MSGNYILLIFTIFCGLYILLGMKVLGGERWQIAAAVPLTKDTDGEWRGINLTWYGILTANAYVVAVAVAICLLGAVQAPMLACALLIVAMLAICVPSSRIVAGIVEGKANTFTVGGAVFVGTIVAPWLALTGNAMLERYTGKGFFPVAVIAAFAISYAYGEGLGRLACISFGCCYGKPVRNAGQLTQRIFGSYGITVRGSTKKAAYASGLEGEKLLPVQGLSALVCTVAATAGTMLYINGKYSVAFLTTLAVTQLWRVAAETMRSDYRGEARFSAYQKMGIAAIVYSWVMVLFIGDGGVMPSVSNGLELLWAPLPVLMLQLLWVVIFIYTGISRVTAAKLVFSVKRTHI